MPDSLSNEPTLVLDPFPGLGVVGPLPELIPGIVFWLPNGKVHFLNLEDAHRVYTEIYHRWQRGGFLDTVSANFVRSRTHAAALEAQRVLATLRRKPLWMQSRSAKIVHLSDLHFGNNAGWRAKVHLLNHLKTSELQGRAVPVITGDLVDTPDVGSIDIFEEFRFLIRQGLGPFRTNCCPGESSIRSGWDYRLARSARGIR